MQVRIIKGSSWYSDKVGKVFNVLEDERYYYLPGAMPAMNICKEHADIVTVKEKKESDGINKNYHIIDALKYGLGVHDIKKQTGTTDEAKHYQIGTVQPIEVMQNTMTKEQFIGYCLGNVIKYSQRINHKGQFRSDAGKCKQYAEWLICAIDDIQIVPGGKT